MANSETPMIWGFPATQPTWGATHKILTQIKNLISGIKSNHHQGRRFTTRTKAKLCKCKDS